MADHTSGDADDDEISRRRDDAIRRALNTPPKPGKEMLGKTGRAQSERTTKTVRARRLKPKGDVAS
jgi:hypothetical protein